ncbi:hypothetical protein HPT27_05500 [Permianibacter sp. IMCC34836]|uniref:hypothetical protein n=1 Tax=Permianibacter fluminis TaxID=2738515 RepID=UPI001556CAF9|nr:hypothetical protein [Permianibacter fluminis]NQD36474.1 hypothetical protein [Permianibacter fluminis]
MMTGLGRKFIDGVVFGIGFSIALVGIVFAFTKLESAGAATNVSGQLSPSDLTRLRAVVEKVNFVSNRISVEGKVTNASDVAVTSLYLEAMVRVGGVPIDKCSQSVKQRIEPDEATPFVIICGKSTEIADPAQLAADVSIEAAYSK